MTASDIAAWWGAGVATIVLFWDIFKWSTDGPKLVMQISVNMIEVGNGIGKTKYVYAKVYNIGNAPTTIESFCGYSPAKGLAGLRKRNGTHFIIPNPRAGQGLNFVLRPGEFWAGSVLQDEIEKDFRGRKVYLGIYHSFKPNKPLFKRVIFRTIRADKEVGKGDSQ